MVKLYLFMELAVASNQLLGVAEAGHLHSDIGDRRELDLAAARIGLESERACDGLFYHYDLSGVSLGRAKKLFILAKREELTHDMEHQVL